MHDFDSIRNLDLGKSARIDHDKSDLAERMLKVTDAIQLPEMTERIPDSAEPEQETGTADRTGCTRKCAEPETVKKTAR